MFEQDYIMRLIKEMVRAILKLLFHIDVQSPTEELLEETENRVELEGLTDMIDNGDINHAENRLYAMIEEDMENGSGETAFRKISSMEKLKIAVLFYSYLNEKEDDFLTEHNFSREEVKMGLEDVLSKFGYEGLDGLF